jgi:GDP-L-fucose synthase
MAKTIIRKTMNKNSKIFVAGHCGMIGSALVRKLKANGYDNLLLKTKKELDLRNQNDVQCFFKEEKPEYVFLSAAKVGGISYNNTVPAEFIYDNIQIQNNVIHNSYLNNVKKLLFLGSACIYPKITPQPIKEEYLLTNTLEPTNEAYAIAKISGLKMCQYYTKQYGFNTISLMPTNLYGINDNFNLDQCHVIAAIIRKFLNAKDKGERSITCFGDGSPTREFLYCDDLADACVFLMNNYDSPEIINVGSDGEVTIKKLVETIKQKVNFEGDIIWDTSKPNGTPLRKLSYDKIKSLGWQAKINLEIGLTKTISWYLENRKTYTRN